MFTNKFEPVQEGSLCNTTIANGAKDIPMSFIPNKGQSKIPSLYYSRGANSAVHFNKDEIFFAFIKPSHQHASLQPQTWNSKTNSSSAAQDMGLVLSMRFIDANPGVSILAEQECGTRVNFFSGQDPSKWFTGIPVYQQINYRDLWPGINMTLIGRKGQIKYEFIAKPGADINNIRLSYNGADDIILDEKGNLQIHSCIGTITDYAPICYQTINGKQVELTGRFVLEKTSDNEYVYGFSISQEYDPSYSLVIDPGLDYSTYLGGTDNDQGRAIAVDSSGYAYISGATFSDNFPTTPGSFQPANAGAYDAFITKMDTSGSSLVWSTYLGGSGVDMANAMVLDTALNVIVGGMTTSTNFPVTVVPPPLVNTSAFLTKINSTGDSLIWSLAFGGDGFDYLYSLALDSDEDIYAAGETSSTNLPVTPGAVQPTLGGMSDGYIIKINSAASAIVYWTYLGGSNVDACKSLAVDADKNAYLCGFTLSNDFPVTAGAYQSVIAGDTCGFVTKINVDATSLLYSTYLGGSIHDQSTSITIDSNRFAYICGYSNSPDFPTTPGVYQDVLQGYFDATVTKLNQNGSNLVWSTFIGGSTGDDQGLGILLDAYSNVYVAGSTNSLNFPVTPDAYQSFYAGNTDAFLSKLNSTGSSLLYSTFLGGLNQDIAQGMALDDQGNVYLTGITFSENFPVTAGAFQETMPGFMGFSDGFVTKFDFQPPPPPSGGVFRLVRYVINTTDDFPDDAQQFDADFFLVPDDRKIINGTVRFPDGTPAPAAVVKFFKMLNPTDDPETTCDLESIGHAITDDCGQFLLGPLPPDVNVIIKIFFLQNASAMGTPIPYIGTATPINP